MDDRQHDVLLVACREAYCCLRDRNRPQVMVEGRLIHSDADLAAAIRHLAKQLFSLQIERNALVQEIQPLWEAQISGALGRLLHAVEQVQSVEAGGWPARNSAAAAELGESDLQLLRTLVARPEHDQRVA